MKPIIVISAVNFTRGGPLSILIDVLNFAEIYLAKRFKVIALVHKVSLFNSSDFKNIHFMEFPFSTKSYLYRLYLEYFYFKKVSKDLKPKLWLSLHDITPNVEAEIRAVYCHNPAPFYKVSCFEIKLDMKFFLFNWLYKFIYAINIKKNNFVIVQQDWLRKNFSKDFNLDIRKIVVSYPTVTFPVTEENNKKEITSKFIFFFPSLPRVFKNIETLCEAVKLLNENNISSHFELILTITGNENRYAKYLFSKYSDIENIKFSGLLSREEVYRQYQQSDCMIFPSKLETWGLPITEAKNFNLPILVPDIPYAYETVGNYDRVSFFSADDPTDLAKKMKLLMEGETGAVSDFIFPSELFSENWKDLFELLLGSDI